MTIANAVEQASRVVSEVTNALVAHDPVAVLIEGPFPDFSTHLELLFDTVTPAQFETYKSSVESNQDGLQLFNEDIGERSSGFALVTALRRALSDVFSLFVAVKAAESDPSSSYILFHGIKIDTNAAQLLNKCAIILDMHISIAKLSPSESTGLSPVAVSAIKSAYFPAVSFVVSSAFLVLLSLAEAFWFHVEARKETYTRTSFFNRNLTSDRIAVLEMCNGITDKYVEGKHLLGKEFNSYSKDTYNDEFYARVRLFLAGMLSLEDNTGLNKYFNCLQASVRDPQFKQSFLADIMQLVRLFRDPYHYIRRENHKKLTRTIDIMEKIAQYLARDEAKYQDSHPTRDQFAIPAAKTTAENEIVAAKYADRLYFAEDYFLSQFNGVRSDRKALETLRAEDEEFYNAQFDRPEARQAFILQIYIISSFLAELTLRRKQHFLALFPSGTKHIVSSEVVPEAVGTQLIAIKRNIVSVLRRNNQNYVHLLQHLFFTEVYWWQWLVYGKDSQGRPLFSDRLLEEETLRGVQERHASILPLKEKRYFNTFATPQLTRKMRLQSGIERLATPEDRIDSEVVFKDKVAALEAPLGLEERNGLLWKYLRAARAKVWLELGTKVSPEEITKEEIKIEGSLEEDAEMLDLELADAQSENEDGQYSPSVELPEGEDEQSPKNEQDHPSEEHEQSEVENTPDVVEPEEKAKRLLEEDAGEAGVEEQVKRAKLEETVS